MKRYWFKFKDSERLPSGIRMGCGITAFNLEDAKSILQDKVFLKDTYDVESFVENIDISTLDKNHVLPNMASPNIRGIWFPLGY